MDDKALAASVLETLAALWLKQHGETGFEVTAIMKGAPA